MADFEPLAIASATVPLVTVGAGSTRVTIPTMRNGLLPRLILVQVAEAVAGDPALVTMGDGNVSAASGRSIMLVGDGRPVVLERGDNTHLAAKLGGTNNPTVYVTALEG